MHGSYKHLMHVLNMINVLILQVLSMIHVRIIQDNSMKPFKKLTIIIHKTL